MTDDIRPEELVLGELIERLEQEPLGKRLKLGFANPHSYRGYYEQLAFEPARNVTVGEMLAAARSALGKTFQGWKGGDYVMDEGSCVWLAQQGDCGEMLGALLLECMIDDPSEDQPAPSPAGSVPLPTPTPELDEAAQALVDQTRMKGMSVQDGAATLELEPAHELVVAWVAAARTMLGDAPNYSETRIDFPTAKAEMEVKLAGEYERFVFTLQRAGKVTPHEARKLAESERDEARQELATTREKLHHLDLIMGEVRELAEVDGEATDELVVHTLQERLSDASKKLLALEHPERPPWTPVRPVDPWDPQETDSPVSPAVPEDPATPTREPFLTPKLLDELRAVAAWNAEQSLRTEPRVWHKGDPEPEDHPTVKDRRATTWTHHENGCWVTDWNEIAPWDLLCKLADPLTEVPASPSLPEEEGQ